MDAAVIATRLRSAGYLPALVDGKVRLYGDVTNLPPELWAALAASRDPVAAYLGQPAQAVAYDLLAAATEAGWFPYLSVEGLHWRKGQGHTSNPLRSKPFRDALTHHLEQVAALCACLDIDRAHGTPPVMLPGPAPTPPPEGPYHRIWTCAGCQLPRSVNDRPCPGCGACDGYVALRPANRFTGFR